VADLTTDQKEKEQTEYKIETDEAINVKIVSPLLTTLL